MDGQELIEILSLASTLEPPVLAFFKTLLTKANGMSGDEFLAQADDIWAQVKANAQGQLGKG